jgi:hypothetical protein
VLEVVKRRKVELDEDVREHVGGGATSEGDGALLDEVSDVVVIDVDVLRLRGGHVVCGEGDTSFVVYIGSRCR